MTIEDEREFPLPRWEDYDDATDPNLGIGRNIPPIEELIARHKLIQSKTTHHRLRDDLVEHV
jgi:hypothetical protein